MRRFHLITPLLFFMLLLITGGNMVFAEERTRIGMLEEVILFPYGVRLDARIDTGAAMCSLDARDLKVVDDVATFRLSKHYGGLKLELPVVQWRTIRNAEAREKRPVVELEFCVGPRKVKVLVNLNDRSGVRYPLIIGRNLLKENFLVDCIETKCAPPVCPEVPAK
jgi:hypothetical protein